MLIITDVILVHAAPSMTTPLFSRAQPVQEASLTVADLAEVGQRHPVRTVSVGPGPSPLIKELKGYFYSNLGGTPHRTTREGLGYGATPEGSVYPPGEGGTRGTGESF